MRGVSGTKIGGGDLRLCRKFLPEFVGTGGTARKIGAAWGHDSAGKERGNGEESRGFKEQQTVYQLVA